MNQKISIEVYNNYALIRKLLHPKDLYLECKNFLRAAYYEQIKVGDHYERHKKFYYMFEEIDDGLKFGPGLIKLFPAQVVEIIDHMTYTIPKFSYSDLDDAVISEYLKPYVEFSLRDDQVFAIKKGIVCRRGIIQMATGAGKTECEAAIIKIIADKIDRVPKTLVIEPTIYLMEENMKRWSNLGLECTTYNEWRDMSVCQIFFTHPMSLNNDLEKDPELLRDVEIIIFDEGHHLQAETWRKLLESCPKLQYCLAFSASVVERDNVGTDSKDDYSLEEQLVISGTGPIIVNLPMKYYRDRGILANPIVFRLYNPADEYTPGRSWHELRQFRLESARRSANTAKCASFFSLLGRKVLILVNTKKQAYTLMKYIHEFKVSYLARISFGGGEFYKIDESGKIVYDDSDVMNQYNCGDIKILIGTTHLDEGMDIRQLDVVIMAGGTRKDRRIIQRVGRVMRKSKSGKYAYIVDFTDSNDSTLSRHAEERMEIYKYDVGVMDSEIYDNISFTELKKIFIDLEGDGQHC